MNDASSNDAPTSADPPDSPHPDSPGADAPEPRLQTCALPNGLTVYCRSQTEATFFYDDIFADRVYLQHGLTLPSEPCVFDVGANIGMFTLFVHFMAVRPTIFSFEPAPPVFDALTANVEEYGVNAHLMPYGLSDRESEATLTYYPRSSGMSSIHGDREEEQSILNTIMQNQARAGQEGMDHVLAHQDDLLEKRFESKTVPCRLRPLSDVVDEHDVDRIDLLKVDVQKAEHEVLGGIRDAHWPMIQQVVVEVHDDDGRLADVKRTLGDRGFQVAVEQEPLYEGTNIYNLYARR